MADAAETTQEAGKAIENSKYTKTYQKETKSCAKDKYQIPIPNTNTKYKY